MTTPGPDTEPITIAHCRRCGQPTLQALTEGIHITCAPQLLDIPQQIQTSLTGQPTYELLRYVAGHLEFAQRTPSRIRHRPDAPVVAAHRCTAPPLDWKTAARLPDRQALTTRHRTLEEALDDPPF